MGGSERWSHNSKKYITTRTGKKLYYQFDDMTQEDIRFDLEEDYSTTDSNVSTSNISSYIIYPAGESWVGVDQCTSEVDPELYQIFIDFLKEYFTEDLNKFWEKYDSIIKNEGFTEEEAKLRKVKKHRNSSEAGNSKTSGIINYSSEDAYRAIPGGRYGCAQFAKTCGPSELSKCSLGKLSQMVQKAISDEIIKYQKTLLVWTEFMEKDSTISIGTLEEQNKKQKEINHKLEIVYRALIDVLLMIPEGISLAQLPNHLKNKLPFPLVVSELGFNKLKDLILSMGDNIKIEHRGHNHPFAVLQNPEAYHRSGRSEEYVNYSQGFSGYYHYPHPSQEVGPPKTMYRPNEYEAYNYNTSHPVMATNYYPMYPNYQQPHPGQQAELRRNESSSSFQSMEKCGFTKTANNDSFYIPQANSLYGSVSGQNYQPHLNISHFRNNTESDIGSDHTLLLTAKHKPVNLSHDFTLAHGRPNKIWIHPTRGGPDDLLEINSSGFLSEENSMFIRSRSSSPNHTRTVSNLNDPNYFTDFSNFQNNFSGGMNRISEERKSEEDAGSTQELEDIIGKLYI